MAIDRQLRLGQFGWQEAGGVGRGRTLRAASQGPGQPVQQLGHAQSSAMVADLGRGPGTIDLDAQDFRDGEDPPQEAAAELRASRAEDLVVVKLECLLAPAHADAGGWRGGCLGLSVDHHAALGGRGGRDRFA